MWRCCERRECLKYKKNHFNYYSDFRKRYIVNWIFGCFNLLPWWLLRCRYLGLISNMLVGIIVESCNVHKQDNNTLLFGWRDWRCLLWEERARKTLYRMRSADQAMVDRKVDWWSNEIGCWWQTPIRGGRRTSISMVLGRDCVKHYEQS